ncbi:MAG TPA: hypothetical protein VIJ38_17495, partial [Acidobacteriaceae bacterium]
MFKGVRWSPATLAAAMFLVAAATAPRLNAQQAPAQQAAATSIAASPASTDKYLWLEDVSSPRSMAWVRAENARSLKVLEADPRYATYHEEA